MHTTPPPSHVSVSLMHFSERGLGTRLMYLSVLEFDAHGVRLILKDLYLEADAAEIILKLAQHLLHTLVCVCVCV